MYSKSFFYGIAAKGWAALYVPLQLLLITHHFSPTLQGYYYTFMGLLTLQTLAELGLTPILVHFVAHEYNCKERLFALGRKTMVWYFFSALFLTLLLLCVGLWLFRGHEESLWPWIFLSIMAGLNLLTLPLLAFVEGIGDVNQLYFIRLLQSLIMGIATMVSIYGGASLWSPSIALFCLNGWTFSYLYVKYRSFFKNFFIYPADAFSWKQELLGLQVKSGCLALCTYLSYCLFNPIIFHFFGAIVAGQLGMTLAIGSALTQVATLGVQIYRSQFSRLIVHKNQAKQTRLLHNIIFSTFVAAIALFFLSWIFLKFSFLASRVLPSPFLESFLVGALFYTLWQPFATFMRAFKKEPLLWVSVFFSGASVITTLGFSVWGNLYAVSLSFALINILYCFFVIVKWRHFQSFPSFEFP